MKHWLCQLSIAWTLIVAQIFVPLHALAESSQRSFPITSSKSVSMQDALNIGLENNSRAIVQRMFGQNSAELEQRAQDALAGRNNSENRLTHSKGKVVGKVAAGTVWGDVIQAFIIMAAFTVAGILKQRLEQRKLYGEVDPSIVQAEAEKATEELFCSGSIESTTVSKEIGCSGEFWMGVIGGVAVRGAVLEPALRTALWLLNYIAKKPTALKALITVIARTSVTMLTLFGYSMSGILWTQAVQVLNDPQKEEQAHNIFGRSLYHWVHPKRWAEYVKTPDGALAQEVFRNAFNILIVDKEQRKAWLYNGWRFGLARGEFVMAMTVLMGAMTIGSGVGATVGAAVLAASPVLLVGLSAAVVTTICVAVVSTLFAIGASFLMVFLGGDSISQWLTKSIQNMRMWYQSFRHSRALFNLNELVAKFDVDRWKMNPDLLAKGVDLSNLFEHYRKDELEEGNRDFDKTLEALRHHRTRWVNVAIEKYKELKDQVDSARQLIVEVEEAVRNSRLRDVLVVNFEDTVISYNEAKRRHCGKPKVRVNARQQLDNCDAPEANKLKAIATARQTIADGNLLLTEMASDVISVYQSDSEQLEQTIRNPNLQFPVAVAKSLSEEQARVAKMNGLFQIYFAALHSKIREQYPLDLSDYGQSPLPSQQNAMLESLKMAAGQFLKQNYTMGVREDVITHCLGDDKPAECG